MTNDDKKINIIYLKNGTCMKTDLTMAVRIGADLCDVNISEDFIYQGKKELKKEDISYVQLADSTIYQRPEPKKENPRYYKVVTGTFNEISIPEKELPKAIWSYSRSEGAVFDGGACSEIKDVLPDKVKSMGWNTGYKLKPEDAGDVAKELGRSLENMISETKKLVANSKTLFDVEVLFAQIDLEKLSTSLLSAGEVKQIGNY